MGIAEQMGRVLQRTSISVNIKERLDFSCALFGPDGQWGDACKGIMLDVQLECSCITPHTPSGQPGVWLAWDLEFVLQPLLCASALSVVFASCH